jgi:hypothetical protein
VSAVRDAPFEEVPLGYFARKVPIQLFNYFTCCKIFIAKELRQSGMQGAAGHKTSLYLIACLLGRSPSGGWAFNHLGQSGIDNNQPNLPRESSA